MIEVIKFLFDCLQVKVPASYWVLLAVFISILAYSWKQ